MRNKLMIGDSSPYHIIAYHQSFSHYTSSLCRTHESEQQAATSLIYTVPKLLVIPIQSEVYPNIMPSLYLGLKIVNGFYGLANSSLDH